MLIVNECFISYVSVLTQLMQTVSATPLVRASTRPAIRFPQVPTTPSSIEARACLSSFHTVQETTRVALPRGALFHFPQLPIPTTRLRPSAPVAATAHHSDVFVPFICAVINVHHPYIALLHQAFDNVEPGLWERMITVYTAEFVRRGYDAHHIDVVWRFGCGPGTPQPYIERASQELLLEPPDNDHNRLIQWQDYGNFNRVAPHIMRYTT